MKPSVRYRDYLQAIGAWRRDLSYNALIPSAGRDEWGRPLPRATPSVIRLHRDEVIGLLRPYVTLRFMDQLKAVATPFALPDCVPYEAGATGMDSQ